jgi:2'-5' RNA ligase
MRLFWALRLPSAQRAWIAVAQGELRDHLPGARWSDPLQGHLTLCFLGELEPSRVGDILAAGRAALRTLAPIDLRWMGLTAFPRLASVRTLVLMAEGGAELDGAHGTLCTAMAPFAALEARAFRPHLTLARFKAPTRVAKLPDLALPPGHRAGAATLFRSTLRPEGAVHEALGDAGFGQARP